MESKDNLDSLLLEYDKRSEPFSEAEVFDDINRLIKKKKQEWKDQGIDLKLKLSIEAERMAFGFHGYTLAERNPWDTYYGPCLSGKTEDNKVICYPDKEDITPEIIEYWKKRFGEATNPTLKIRYADILWDFCKKKAWC